MPRLIVVSGVDDGKQFELDNRDMEIGRDASSQIRLHDPEVSRHHARLALNQGGLRLVDLGSANGLFVNSTRVSSADLKNGDRIEIGNTTLVLVDETTAGAASTATARVLDHQEKDLSSVIVHRVESTEGSRILTASDAERSPWLQTRLANLNILYEAIQAVSHILDLDQLLDKILELLFRSVEADRGCILLRDSAGAPLQSRAARWREGVGSTNEIAVSRTIVDYVLKNQQGVQIADAGQDQRFASGQSVLRYGIREAICVPLTGRRECVGVLYFDTRRPMRAVQSEQTRFTPDHLTLAVAVGHQAALAVEETRYYQARIRSERLAAVGQAIAVLSHHIKNMLQGLKSGGELLKLGIADNDSNALQSGWRLFEKNQTRLFDLVLDMLSYSKDREPMRELTDLSQLISDVVELMRPRAVDNNVSLNYQKQNTQDVSVDPEGIHRAVLNLVTNAIEATSGRPRARVRVVLQIDKNTEIVRIEIHDNGSGMSGEQIRHLFQPFHSSKGSSGTGLGLAVSRKIAREHGGDLTVSSQPGEGSCFVMTLPLCLEESLPETKDSL